MSQTWSRDFQAPYTENVFNFMKTLVHEAQTILEREQVDMAVHERLLSLRKKREVRTTAYDKKVKSNWAMTTGWSPMTNLLDGFQFSKNNAKRVQGVIQYKPHGSMFVLATIIFVFDIPKIAPPFVKACNRRQDSQTWDPQAPLMAHQVDKRVVQAIRDGPKSTTSLSACCDRDSDTDERTNRKRRKQSQRSAKTQK